jgi:hypothetical protein
VATPPKKPTEDKTTALHDLVVDLVAALTEAPNPRIAGGSPAYWLWFDTVRKKALEQAEQV